MILALLVVLRAMTGVLSAPLTSMEPQLAQSHMQHALSLKDSRLLTIRAGQLSSRLSSGATSSKATWTVWRLLTNGAFECWGCYTTVTRLRRRRVY
jgi:hypothetical protein